MSAADLGNLSAAAKRALLADRLRSRRKQRQQFPASFSQQRLWFLERLSPGGAAYNVSGAVRVLGRLDLEAWRRSCVEIVSRHEALRTTFDEVDGQPVQIVAASGEPEFEVLDCAHLRGDGEQEAIAALARVQFARPFDLRTGPLLRVIFLRLTDDEHVLLLTMHHIVADLWSMSVAIDELVTLYGVLSGDSGDVARSSDTVRQALPPLPIQYADYAVWQRDRLAGDGLAADVEYWKRALAGAPSALELPTDRPRPAVQTTRGGSRPFRVSASTAAKLRALSQQEGATAFMALLAGFQVLLHRYTTETDIVVGVPVANRGRVEIERLIGFFVNTLALRTDVSGDPSFRQLLGRVRGICLGAFAHQELPFERLVEVLAPRRDLSRSPIFQVSFIYQNIPMPEFDVSGLRLVPVEVESSTSRFDLELQAFERPGGEVTGWFEYNSDLFDAVTVDRLSARLSVLLDALVADPDAPVSAVSIIDDDELQQVRLAGVGPRRQWSAPVVVTDRFAAVAAANDQRPALRHRAQVLTYGEVDRRSGRLAGRLRELGVQRGVLVGVCVERGTDMVVAVLAVLKAGGAFVPLDPGFPQQRLAFMVTDSALSVLLTNQSVAEALGIEAGGPIGQAVSSGDVVVAYLDGDGDGDGGDSDQDTADQMFQNDPSLSFSGPSGDDVAYVIYTSGSTGMPKGVRISHSALGNFLLSMGERPGLRDDDVLLAVTTLSFDISLLELLLPLVSGAQVVVADREVAADGLRLADALGAYGITVMQATPSTWRMLLDAGWSPVRGFRALAGGEALPVELATRLLDKGVMLWNMYGPTETTIWSAVARVDGKAVLLGEPIANTELHILDERGQSVPDGIPGELYIGGHGLALGYLNRPELTEQRFITHPFPVGLGDRLYRTGDVVRRRHDGGIEFLGRVDHQVKLRGYRVELGEVEAALVDQPCVGEAVALVREDNPGDARLVAYLVADPEGLDQLGDDVVEEVDQWRRVWDAAYADRVDSRDDGHDVDPTFDIRGWNSSYTGQPVPAEQMREWVAATAGEVTRLRPRSVLDVGCGTGLILFSLAQHCELYWGTDVSSVALGRLRETVERGGESLRHVRLFDVAADRLADLPEQKFDAVLLSSVVQYFADERYLLKVIGSALSRLRPGGTLVIADVRSLPLLETFHASVALTNAAGEASAEHLARRVARQIADEEELVIHPALFELLPTVFPDIVEVRVTPRRGSFANELTRFRYDVLITVAGDTQAAEVPEAGRPAPSVTDLPWSPWSSALDEAAIETLMAERRPELLAIADVPNARLSGIAGIMARLRAAGEAGLTLAAAGLLSSTSDSPDGIDPERLAALGRRHGYQVELDWCRHDDRGLFDVVARRIDDSGQPLARLPKRGTIQPPGQPVRWERYVNGGLRRRARKAVPVLRTALGQRLPDYMIPSTFVFLDAMPMTPNGKVDRAALPAPDAGRRDLTSAYVAPRTPVEQVVAAIWAEALGVDHVGVFDDFFALGGHSLLSTRIVSRIREAFQIDIALHRMFSEPTVAGLCGVLLEDGGRRDAVEKTAQLLMELSELSDDDVARALGSGDGGAGASNGSRR